ncbi:MAG: tripartite tricarboxylate transporter permease [Gammaproteobacteria bacterium WSBS_2016_MAG_OTU1]
MPANIFLALGGVVAGIFVGALPGLTATMAVAVLIPVTFSMQASEALILMGAIYTGAIYGGAYSAILLNTPGTPSAIATTFDGYPMAKKGQGDLAVTLSCFSSVFGGIVGALALLFLSPPLAKAALAFGPAEYFWLAVLGLSLVSALSADDFLKGVIGACFGMLLAVIGVAEISADVRLTFGSENLLGGIEIVSALIGLYCLPVLINLTAHSRRHLDKPPPSQGYQIAEAWKITIVGRWNLIRSSVIGTLVGILPGAGGSIAGLVAYSEARRNAKNPQDFGTGEPAGVQATESANSATVGGGLIPTLVLGIPGTPPDAVILGALLIQGIRTGPDLFLSGGVAHTFIWGLLLATCLMLPVGMLIGRRAYRFIASVPNTLLAPLIGFLTIIGSFSIRNSSSDVVMMVLLGGVGWVMARFSFSVSPVVLGLILSSIAEQGFVQTWTIGAATDNLFGGFFGDPLSLAIIILTTITFIAGFKGKKKVVAVAKTGKMNWRDAGAAIFFLIISGIVFFDTAGYVDSDSYVFPDTVAMAMTFFSLLLLLRAWRLVSPPMQPIEGSMLRRLGAVAAMLSAAVAMFWVGFLVSAAVAMFSLTLLSNFEKWTWRRAAGHIACLIAVSTALFLLFTRVFLIPLPAGIWFN